LLKNDPTGGLVVDSSVAAKPPAAPNKKTFLKKGTRKYLSNAQVRSNTGKKKTSKNANKDSKNNGNSDEK
jgi:hypothetical protein